MTEPMDNFSVHVCAYTKPSFDKAIELIVGDKGTIASWDCDGDWLRLFWYKDKNDATQAFPVKLDSSGTKTMVWSWLQEHKPSGNEPDIDGSCSPGFEIITEHGGWSYILFKVRSIWAEHHK